MSVDLDKRIALTRAEAAEAVGLSQDTIRRAVAAGDLVEHFPTPGKAVILVDELRAWISSAPTGRGSRARS